MHCVICPWPNECPMQKMENGENKTTVKKTTKKKNIKVNKLIV